MRIKGDEGKQVSKTIKGHVQKREGQSSQRQGKEGIHVSATNQRTIFFHTDFGSLEFWDKLIMEDVSAVNKQRGFLTSKS